MKLTKEQAKHIIAQVHNDLDLDHSNKYPIFCTFHEKTIKNNDLKIDYWGGGYDYSDPEAVGDDSWGKYTEWLITVDDEIGEAIAIHHYTGHYQIALNKKGKYEIIKQLYRDTK